MILVTGSNGFLSTRLIEVYQGSELALLDRNPVSKHLGYPYFSAEINSVDNYSQALVGCDVVVHCAARVHIMDDKVENPLSLYREANTSGTLNLARQAIAAGVKRFIFISSIKVNGECTPQDKAFTASDRRLPQDDYGISKSEAEVQLLALAKNTAMDVVIIRPTLVYGPGVKANFASLMRLVSKGIPLPFGCINKNKRSLVSIDNLVDLILTCIDHPNAANQVFLVSDDYDVSTSQMVREMATALGKPTWQLPVPVWCYQLIGKLFNKSDVVNRLTGSLQVDICHTKDTLGWTPPQSLQSGFKQTAQAFLKSTINSEHT
ncbi:UDP-glucose 4-epimerase family protein [Aeromonas veronii]|uniref:UDP-glucose 4-epimerase family protein n=1 Tax=Aeromonas veronii TaxID=654 RepID=UPI001F21B333|nr:SDR family oxidoreductase [Aeromonas veronii]